ncbi:helix-turn-helix domain-containing protein [Erysipelothrix rhusiopathiae]|nr:helix-turn-helix domain-containing protein [Erysipelothrix rhusiopathiae]
MSIDMQSGIVKFGHEMVNLSTIEYRLLLFFISHINEIVKREDLYELIWDSMEYVNDNALSASIKRLREKFNGELDIVTVRGQGYRYKHENTQR